MNAAARRLVIAAVAAPSIGAVAVVALIVTAFAALAGTGSDPADSTSRGSVCAAAGADDSGACVGGTSDASGSSAGGGSGSLGGSSDGVTAGGWGGYSKGLIPAAGLCPLSAAGQMLRCDAAGQWNAMSAAYRADSGSPICITDSYRSMAVQVRLRAEKPTLAAVPGTSNHGWALAVDLCEAGRTAMDFSTRTYVWLKANAAGFGWVHPAWAEPGRGQEEPWHWEYVGSAS
jgi:hypothetical protein